MKRRFFAALIFLVGSSMFGAALSAQVATPPAGTRSAASLYQLRSAWTDQNGATFRLGQLSGYPTLVVMFYGSCRYACPLLLQDAKAFEAALTQQERAALRVIFVTIDPDVDTAPLLRNLASEHRVDLTRWRFLRGSQNDIRMLANVLGVKYRRLEGGHFSHSNLLTLIGPRGEILHQTEGLGQPPGAMVERFRRARSGAR